MMSMVNIIAAVNCHWDRHSMVHNVKLKRTENKRTELLVATHGLVEYFNPWVSQQIC